MSMGEKHMQATTNQRNRRAGSPLRALAMRALAAVLAVGLIWPQHMVMAQAVQSGSPAPSSVLSTGGGQALLDPSDTVMLLLDHQSGLFQTVKDISVSELRANTVALAKLATLLKIPVITTASEPNGPNGPLMPEIHQAAPHAVFVPRKGEVNAWDNDDFVKAVRATGKKTLIMAGVWTSVCVMFPALDAKAAGFKVYAVIDASGDPSELTSRTTLARFAQAGVIPTSANAVLSEIHRTWNRPEAAELAKLYALATPHWWRATRRHRTSPSSPNEDPHPNSLEIAMATTIKVNGVDRTVDVDGDTPLLWVLRDVLGMTGTKFGCGMALCGACTVHVDGIAIRSCITPVDSIGVSEITTIEAIGATAAGAKIQKAWLDREVVQCGYCQSGQIMSASALLASNPHPTDADIDDAMSGNICRCGTYVRIREAIKQAAQSNRQGG